MLEERSILYFTPFYFRNNKGSKDKFFVVLKNLGEKAILASLPTSKDHIPPDIEIKDGCVEEPKIQQNCFIITPISTVTECGKSFEKNTFLYGHLLADYDILGIEKTYPVEGVNFEVWGKMDIVMYRKLIACFKNSASVKQKYKKLLCL